MFQELLGLTNTGDVGENMGHKNLQVGGTHVGSGQIQKLGGGCGGLLEEYGECKDIVREHTLPAPDGAAEPKLPLVQPPDGPPPCHVHE